MKSISTMHRAVDDMQDALAEPRYKIGFKYIALDIPSNIDLDLQMLMLHFGYTEEYELCRSFYEKHSDSIAMPMSGGIDAFFEHLKDVGIYKKDMPDGALEQTPQTKSIYEDIVRQRLI